MMTLLSPLLPPFWAIAMLGGLRVVRTLSNAPGPTSSRDIEVIERFRTQKTGALLAYLACFPDKEHSREVVIDLMWPEANTDTGRNNLSIALSSLRKQMEPPGIPPGTVIRASRRAVRLNAGAFTTDVGQVRASLAAAARATSPAERETHLREIQRHWGGSLLPAYYDDWVVWERQRLSDDVARLVIVTATQLLAERGTESSRASEYARWGKVNLEGVQGHLSDTLSGLSDTEPPAGTAFVPVPPAMLPPTGGTVTLLLVAELPSGADGASTVRRHGGTVGSPWSAEVMTAAAPRAAFQAVFRRAGDAGACAREFQKQGGTPPRMAVLTGDAEMNSQGVCEGALLVSATALLAAAADEQTLVSETAAALMRRSDNASENDLRLQDLGIFRLAGEDNPERLFEMTAPDRFPRPPRATPAVPVDRLPLALTRFFGRDEEIAFLLGALIAARETTDCSGVLLTLTGPGGVGKTRLALEAARRLRVPRQTLPPTIWYVPLADVREPGDLPRAVWNVVAAGGGDSGSSTAAASLPLEERIAAVLFGSSDVAPTLLLLDNLEHLVAEAGALITALRKRVPGLLILSTSRRPLAINGEQVFAVEPLPVPGNSDTLTRPETLAENAAARLFVDRARAVRPDFQITGSNMEAVAGLIQRLEGIPLAIELAAARAQVLTPTRILSSLNEHGAVHLRNRQGNIPARHRSLEAAVEGSFRDLSGELQEFFRGLSVFTGGWTLDAAQQSAGADLAEVTDHLAVLRDRSMITARETEAGEMRFGMLETLRAFGAARLQAAENAEADAWRLRHARFFLAFAARASQELDGGDQGLWLRLLREERANLYAALRWSGDNYPDLSLEMAAHLGRFWDMGGDWD
ncbi:MAG: hypothetical protein H8F28_15260 [Fibrella sp.]|nr:hypothetical protein [Armatimonadota bacterium]